MTPVNPKPRVSGSPRERSAHVFAHRVLDALGAVYVFVWQAALLIVFIDFCLTTHH